MHGPHVARCGESACVDPPKLLLIFIQPRTGLLSCENSTCIAMSVFLNSRLHDKVVFVTGASSGIGAATAQLFAQAGANVVLGARRMEKLEHVQAACERANADGATGHGGRYASIFLDMRSSQNIETVLQRMPEWAKRVDVLVNNAGLAAGTDKVGAIRHEDLSAMLDTNVRGLIEMTQVFVLLHPNQGAQEHLQADQETCEAELLQHTNAWLLRRAYALHIVHSFRGKVFLPYWQWSGSVSRVHQHAVSPDPVRVPCLL